MMGDSRSQRACDHDRCFALGGAYGREGFWHGVPSFVAELQRQGIGIQELRSRVENAARFWAHLWGESTDAVALRITKLMGQSHGLRDDGAAQQRHEQRTSAIPSRGTPLRLSEVAPKPVDWLWPLRIPLGMITLLEGDPAAGKTTLAIDIAAHVSTGVPFPDGTSSGEPADVLYLSGEDALEQTIVPRLLAARADMDRLHTYNPGAEIGVTMQDVSVIEKLVRWCQAKLLIFDPLTCFLGGGVNMDKGEQTRRVLGPISKLAERCGCAVLIVRHLRKSSADRATYRGLGSIDIAAAARSILLAGSDPSNPDYRALAHTKASVGKEAPTFGYRVEPASVNGEDGKAIDTSRVRWMGPSTLTKDDILAASPDPAERDALAEAMELLRECLADGPVAEKAIRTEASQRGISGGTLKRARQALGVKSSRVSTPGPRGSGQWVLALSDDGPPIVDDDDEEAGVVA